MERDSLARKLRELRVNAGLSQQSLGVKLDRPQSYVSKIENAERRVELHEIEAWANATGKTMYWTFVAQGIEPSGEETGTAGSQDEDMVAGVAWLLPRLELAERGLLQATVSYLLEKIERARR